MTDKSITYKVSYQEIYDGRRSYKIIRSINKSIENGETISNSREMCDILEDKSIEEFIEKIQNKLISDKLFDQFDLVLQIALAEATGIRDLKTAHFGIKDRRQAFKAIGFFLLFIPSVHLLFDPRIVPLIKYWATGRHRVYKSKIRLIMSKDVLSVFDSSSVESAYGVYGDNVNICAQTTTQFANELKDLLWASWICNHEVI